MFSRRPAPLLRQIQQLVGPVPGLSDRELLRRFVVEGDEAALEAVVRRHGPLVRGVCRRMLRNLHDAEDVFQATFLVLTRKAAVIPWQESVGTWLYEVAYRLALQARARSWQRLRRERRPTAPPPPDPLAEVSLREAQAVLDEELSRLPAKFRDPLVLCYLEGTTRDEAACQLGWSLGTLKRRLEQGKERLRHRLSRRGLTVPTVLSAALLTEGVTSAAATTEPTIQVAGGCATEATPSANAVALAEAALRAMRLARLKLVAALVLVFGGLTATVGFTAHRWAAGTAPAETRPLEPPRPADQEAGERHEASPPQAALDRFGDPLPARARARIGTLRFRHGGDVGQTAFSPDGKVLAAASSDDEVTLWQAAMGKELRRLKQATAGIFPGVAFSPDGKLLVTGRYAEIRRWDRATGKELLSFPLKGLTAGKVFFTPDGKVLACLGLDSQSVHTILFLDAVSGKELHRLAGPAHFVAPCLAFSPDSTAWAFANKKDNPVWLYDTRTGKEIRQFKGHTKGAATVAFSPDGKTLASTDFEGTLRFWETATGKPLASGGRFYAQANLTYSPDGTFLAGAGFGLKPHLWEVATGKELNQHEPIQFPSQDVTFSPDGRMLACPIDHTIYLWDTLAGKALQPLQGHQKGVGSVAFAPDGQTLATAAADLGVLHLWETATGTALAARAQLRDYVYAVAYSPGGRLLAVGTGNQNGTVWLLDSATRQVRRKLTGPHVQVTSLAFSTNGQILASKHQNQTIVWDVATGKELRRLEAQGYGSISDAALSPDGKTLADGDSDRGTVRLWDVTIGKELRRLEGHWGGAYAVALSPAGKLLASSGYDKTVRLWDLATGKEVHRMTGHQSWVRFVVFSPDGRTLASGCQDGSVRLWETATGQERGLLVGHQHSVRTGAFSADGTMLATGSDDTTALVWDLTGRQRDASARELEGWWADLAGNDATRAYQSILALAASPRKSVPFLRGRLPPVVAPEPQRVGALLASLDSKQFAERQRAMRELVQLGFAAEPALRKALKEQPSLEVRQRVEQVLGELEAGPRLRAVRAVEALERAGTVEARQGLEALAKGLPGVLPTQEAEVAVARLARRSAAP
jgi:RNA polymerase sigma factor (sigma-70 family)